MVIIAVWGLLTSYSLKYIKLISLIIVIITKSGDFTEFEYGKLESMHKSGSVNQEFFEIEKELDLEETRLWMEMYEE